MSKINETPFIIKAAGICTCCGDTVPVPVGVEISESLEIAIQSAARRWPRYSLLVPEPWEDVPPQVRLLAIEADREIFTDQTQDFPQGTANGSPNTRKEKAMKMFLKNISLCVATGLAYIVFIGIPMQKHITSLEQQLEQAKAQVKTLAEARTLNVYDLPVGHYKKMPGDWRAFIQADDGRPVGITPVIDMDEYTIPDSFSLKYVQGAGDNFKKIILPY